MNSFTLRAIGHLARNPVLIAKGETVYTRICIIGNDYAGRDEEGNARDVVPSLWFTEFDAFGRAIAKNTRKGDQLFIEAQIGANN